ncbi:hypothetical protein BE17_25710 [Sorangium cellulosum]|uniref:Uncharacterized protein n=1 Tax=Sorangium cellulosum TaxID=56 RepID=A0A150SKP0_SORCE|nr:hypothetical protein BE17_25710 [Sorangium cellulosum]
MPIQPAHRDVECGRHIGALRTSIEHDSMGAPADVAGAATRKTRMTWNQRVTHGSAGSVTGRR